MARLSHGPTMPPARWVQDFFQVCKMAEAGHHDLFYGDILGAGVLWCVQNLFHCLVGSGFEL